MIYLQIPWGLDTESDPDWLWVSRPASSEWGGRLSSLGTILTSLMPYIFAISAIILLFMIVASGYSLLTSAGNPEALEKGKKRLTAALTGFLIIFAAFWIWQLVQVFIGIPFV